MNDDPPRIDPHGRRQWLHEKLRERNQSPERVEQIDREVSEALQRRMAVLVLDMCGFSRLTARHGPLFYLAMIVQMAEAATPAVLANRGRVVKQEGDNLFAAFDAPADALEAAIDVQLALDAVNGVVPSDRDVTASIGIGYGELLDAGDDLFGDEMNAACRLGEDLGCERQILLTPAARAAVSRDVHELDEVTFADDEGGTVRAFLWRQRREIATDPPVGR